jgi:hypothetical protein
MTHKRATPPGGNPAARCKQERCGSGFDGVAALPAHSCGAKRNPLRDSLYFWLTTAAWTCWKWPILGECAPLTTHPPVALAQNGAPGG